MTKRKRLTAEERERDRLAHLVIVHPMTLACLHCGQHYAINFPAPVDIVTACSDTFMASHRSCKLGKRGLLCHACFDFGHAWADCPRNQYGGDWRKWLDGPDTGTSSRTICMTLKPSGEPPLYDARSAGGFGTVPLDPSDFGRCHRLLQSILGWRPRIVEMKAVAGWGPLALAWDELERLYLEETAGGARSAPRLYARMQELILQGERERGDVTRTPKAAP